MQNGMVRQRLDGVPDTADVARLLGYRFGVTARQVRDALFGKPDNGYIKANRSSNGQLELDVWGSDETSIFFTI
jgi:hypothetical protein